MSSVSQNYMWLTTQRKGASVLPNIVIHYSQFLENMIIKIIDDTKVERINWLDNRIWIQKDVNRLEW